jgi:pimeloyl-ACP methyl ester carboxylesterase
MATKVARTPERFMAANGLTFCDETFGRRKDPALLLIMGMGAQMIGWDDEFCEALALRSFYVVRLALGYPRHWLGAHRLAVNVGTIGQTLAIHFPDRLRSLTLVMSTTGAPDLPRPRPWAINLVMRPSPRAREEYVDQYVRTWRAMRVMGSDDDDRRDRTRAERNHDRGLNPAGAALL